MTNDEQSPTDQMIKGALTRIAQIVTNTIRFELIMNQLVLIREIRVF